MKSVNDMFSELVKDQLDAIEGANKLILELNNRRDEINELLHPLSQLGMEPSYVSYNHWGRRISLSFWDAETIKQFEPLFQLYADSGIVPLEAWVCEKSGSSRVYNYKPSDALGLVIEVSAKTCKLVQVGTKTVEQPIYETICEEEEPELAAGLTNSETSDTI